jgi:hypothetical protein
MAMLSILFAAQPSFAPTTAVPQPEN